MSLAAIILMLVIPFLVFLVLSVPIGISLGLSSVLYVILFTDFSSTLITQGFFAYLDNFVFIAAPLFILGGMLAERSGMLNELFELMSNLMRRLPGGLGVGFILTSIIFAAITGVSVAAAAAMSTMFLPIMRNYRYDDSFSAGMICAGGGLAMLIPPSLPLIVYGSITETSIAKLFTAGIIPGITMGVLFCILTVFLGRRKGLKGQPMDWGAVKSSFTKAIWGILLPVIVLGCIYSGITTPTEAAGIMVLYALVYGIARGRLGYLRRLLPALGEAVQLTGVLWLLVGGAGIFTMVLTMEQVPLRVVEFVLGTGLGPIAFLLILNVIYILMGMFMDGLSLIVVTMPVVFPIITAFGISPIFFGVMAVVNLEIAVITPPVGLNLYAVSGVSKIPIMQVFKGSIPYLIIMLCFLLFIVFVPEFTLLLTG